VKPIKLIEILKEIMPNENSNNNNITPILLGDCWNEECKGTSTSQKLCDEYGLVNFFKQVHPNPKQFKTYMRGSRTIDFALAPPELAHRVKKIVYKPSIYRLKGDHHAYHLI
jgi:hypothetical protein